MPKIYRSMKSDAEKPAIGPSATALGVRGPDDISPDGQGNVKPVQGGMSVAPSVEHLPYHRVPERLNSRVPGARGSNTLVIWSMGTGDFLEEAIATDLVLRLDPANRSGHGFVEPDKIMTLAAYQEALAATRDEWSVDEEPQV